MNTISVWINQFDLHLFFSTFTLMFLAELPDKTAFAVLMMATRQHPVAIFIGVAAAFAVQSLVAVSFGSVLSLLPPHLIKIMAAILFFVFAWMMWRSRDEEEEEIDASLKGKQFWKSAWSSFVVIFIAEWGDITQLATATLSAQYKNPLTLFLGATGGLWASTALVIFIGTRAKRFIKPPVLKRVAAVAFFGVGVFCLFNLKK